MEVKSTPSKMSHLKAGQDEVHSFLWGKDLEEPITGQQNEPTILGRNKGASATSSLAGGDLRDSSVEEQLAA